MLGNSYRVKTLVTERHRISNEVAADSKLHTKKCKITISWGNADYTWLAFPCARIGVETTLMLMGADFYCPWLAPLFARASLGIAAHLTQDSALPLY